MREIIIKIITTIVVLALSYFILISCDSGNNMELVKKDIVKISF